MMMVTTTKDDTIPLRPTYTYRTVPNTRSGELHLSQAKFKRDYRPIEEGCPCQTCKAYTRAYLNSVLNNKDTVACNAISLHNVSYQMRLMTAIRQSIISQEFPEFVRAFLKKRFREDESEIPNWVRDALESVAIVDL